MLKLLQLIPLFNKLMAFIDKVYDEYQRKKLKQEGNLEGRAEAKAEAQTQVKEDIKEFKAIETEQSQKSDEEINAVLTKGFKR
jgi:septin family protein